MGKLVYRKGQVHILGPGPRGREMSITIPIDRCFEDPEHPASDYFGTAREFGEWVLESIVAAVHDGEEAAGRVVDEYLKARGDVTDSD